MPGIVTNIHIAASVMPDAQPEVWLGAALPNLMALHRDIHAQVVLPKKFLMDEGLATGIRMHGILHRAHQENIVATEMRLLATEDLMSAQNTRDKRRATTYADAATDLLLDGLLTDKPRPRHAVQAVTRRLNESDNPFEVLGPPDFIRFVRGYFEKKKWKRYEEPESVADIIVRRFAARPHSDLQVPAADVPALLEMTKEHQPRLNKRREGLVSSSRSHLARRLVSLAARA